MTFYVNFPPEVIAATAEAAAAAAEEGITVEPDVDLAEKVSRYMIYWLRKNSFFPLGDTSIGNRTSFFGFRQAQIVTFWRNSTVIVSFDFVVVFAKTGGASRYNFLRFSWSRLEKHETRL